jgi:hypothetical protein
MQQCLARICAAFGLVFERYLVRISAGTSPILTVIFVDFLSPSRKVSRWYLVASRPLPSTSFSIHYLPTILPLDAVSADILTASRSTTGIVGFKPTRGMSVCVSSVFVLFCAGSDFATGLIPRPRNPNSCL